MTDEARAELRRRLGEQVAEVVEGLSDAEAERLHTLYREAVTRHRATMATAQERSLALIPALLRPAVRKVLGG